MTPKVSILIPTFNRVSEAAASIRSAITQDFEDIEIVVQDNCSTDGTWETILDLAKHDPRITAMRNPKNLGPTANWLACAKRASAPLSKILFSDDLLAKNCISTLAKAMQNTQVSFAYSTAIIGESPPNGTIHYQIFDSDTLIPAPTFFNLLTNDIGIPVSPCAAIFKSTHLTSILDKIVSEIKTPTFVDLGAGPDILIMAFSSHLSRYVHYTSEPLVYFRRHPGSITHGPRSREVEITYPALRNWLKQHYPQYGIATTYQGMISCDQAL
jgi:glycosyltransferase involved in cell wall biosynthesis